MTNKIVHELHATSRTNASRVVARHIRNLVRDLIPGRIKDKIRWVEGPVKLAHHLDSVGETENALEQLSNLLSRRPRQANLLKASTDILRKNGRFGEAITLTEEHCELHGHAPFAPILAEHQILARIIDSPSSSLEFKTLGHTLSKLASHIQSGNEPLVPELEAFSVVEGLIAAGNIDHALQTLKTLREQGFQGKLLAREASLRMDRLELKTAAALLSEPSTSSPVIKARTRLQCFHTIAKDLAVSSTDEPCEELIRKIAHKYIGQPRENASSQQPRIVLVAASLGRGGLETQLTRLAALLSCAGFEVRVYHDNRYKIISGLSRILHRAGVPATSWKKTIFFRWNRNPYTVGLMGALGQPDSYQGLEAALNKWQPDIVHVMGAPNFISTVALVASHSGVPRIIMNARSQSPAHRLDSAAYQRRRVTDRVVMKELLKQESVYFLTNSRAGLGSYKKWLSHLPTTASVTLNIVDSTQVIEESGDSITPPWPDNATVIGGVFRLANEKRPHLWVEAAFIIAEENPDIHFAICGEGQLNSDIALRADKLRNFHLLGFHSPAAPWIASFDTLLLTSTMEGLPNVCLEAQALGIPVVAPNVGGVSETFLPDISGYLVFDVDNPAAYAEAVLKSLEPNWRSAASIEAKKFVDNNFGGKAQLESLLPSYGVDIADHNLDQNRWKQLTSKADTGG